MYLLELLCLCHTCRSCFDYVILAGVALLMSYLQELLWLGYVPARVALLMSYLQELLWLCHKLSGIALIMSYTCRTCFDYDLYLWVALIMSYTCRSCFDYVICLQELLRLCHMLAGVATIMAYACRNWFDYVIYLKELLSLCHILAGGGFLKHDSRKCTDWESLQELFRYDNSEWQFWRHIPGNQKSCKWLKYRNTVGPC